MTAATTVALFVLGTLVVVLAWGLIIAGAVGYLVWDHDDTERALRIWLELLPEGQHGGLWWYAGGEGVRRFSEELRRDRGEL